ncbi:MAG: hypothetical protein Q7R45_11935 [Sulfuricaulis sp.]|nr:hypothetical protein [Sulfuricaulis sp.]
MATLLDFVTNPDIIACALLFVTVMADCLRRPRLFSPLTVLNK